jgi:hypothetical protein
MPTSFQILSNSSFLSHPTIDTRVGAADSGLRDSQKGTREWQMSLQHTLQNIPAEPKLGACTTSVKQPFQDASLKGTLYLQPPSSDILFDLTKTVQTLGVARQYNNTRSQTCNWPQVR